ncbi:hypothetical protein SEA_FINKLE_32 [Gordonia phage Finkle]|uniref:Uncharacterized protein n=1 Tax=Gordonia phage Finkle TaxID=2926099 RepID=A0A9E7NIL6_9CAUD|nr:hypothetical protein QEH33_gp32 [Gordonia phage Finkle]UTN92951.1 hypothetical protein SEA_FINKLE_32 [Gordonia phage Finkle]
MQKVAHRTSESLRCASGGDDEAPGVSESRGNCVFHAGHLPATTAA